jgi:hypothetical protein
MTSLRVRAVVGACGAVDFVLQGGAEAGDALWGLGWFGKGAGSKKSRCAARPDEPVHLGHCEAFYLAFVARRIGVVGDLGEDDELRCWAALCRVA